MKTINNFKNEVLGALAFLFGFVATLIVSGNSGYYGLTIEDAWVVFALRASICFAIATSTTFAVYYTAEHFNKYASQRILLNIVRKYEAIGEKLLANE